MKKLLSLFAVFAFIQISDADELGKKTRNAFTFSASTTSAVDQAWQIYNSTSNRKHIFIEAIEIASHGAGYFTLYSTSTQNGFTGTKSTATAVNVKSGSNASISTCWQSDGTPSAPTGNVLWQGVILASTTYRLGNEDNPFQIPPGYAVYMIKTNTTNAKSAVSFFFREEPAP